MQHTNLTSISCFIFVSLSLSHFVPRSPNPFPLSLSFLSALGPYPFSFSYFFLVRFSNIFVLFPPMTLVCLPTESEFADTSPIKYFWNGSHANPLQRPFFHQNIIPQKCNLGRILANFLFFFLSKTNLHFYKWSGLQLLLFTSQKSKMLLNIEKAHFLGIKQSTNVLVQT